MRNLTLIKCTLGHATPMSWDGNVYVGAGSARPVIIERKRFVTELPAARARVQVQITDFPSSASAPPRERRP